MAAKRGKNTSERIENCIGFLVAFFVITFFVFAFFFSSNMSIETVGTAFTIATIIMYTTYILFQLGRMLYKGKVLHILLGTIGAWIGFMFFLILFVSIPHGFSWLPQIYFQHIISLEWMNPICKYCILILGVITCFSLLAYIVFQEHKIETSSKPSKLSQTDSAEFIREDFAEEEQAQPITETEKKLNKIYQLYETMQDNFIRIQLVRSRWNFPSKKEILLGIDTPNSSIVFTNGEIMHSISIKNIIYIDYQDTSNEDKPFSRLIKLYYFGRNGKEYIVPFTQTFSNNVAEDNRKFNEIKDLPFNVPSTNEEIIFRRKIRILGSKLDKCEFPNCPFFNDNWFDVLNNSMKKIKNIKSDGYKLFRQKVILATDFENEPLFVKIISELSQEKIDITSAKQEARQLCFSLPFAQKQK